MSDAREAFLAAKRVKGVAAATLESYEDRLAALLADVGSKPVRYLVGRGGELYAAAQVYPEGHKLAGLPRAADTHRNALVVGRMLGSWLVKERWLRVNPFAAVEPAGRTVVGADKSRLTVDESRQLQAYCHEHAATDKGCVMTLAYLLLGPRASELADRTVRDLDDGGQLLWIGKAKTPSGRRRLIVPDELRPYLRALASDRPGDAPLFTGDGGRRWPAGRPWTRHMANHHVRRVCAAAGVPDLAPQALRRTQATLAEDAGATGIQVAAHLGHAVPKAPAVTHRSYVGRDAAANARVERGLRVLQGGRR